MTTIAPSPAPDASWQAHDQEARLLAELLRTSRLTLLFGAAGSDKTALLQSGLMPLLHRRAGDQPAPVAARESGVVVPFPDRRRRSSPATPKRRREFVVYFDAWAGAPLAALHACIHQTIGTGATEPASPPVRLGETLAALSSRLDASFIILIDRFEEFLRAAPEREDIAPFANELVEAVNQADLPANFLLSLDEAVRPRLVGLRSRIPGFDDFSLKLLGPRNAQPATPPEPSPSLPAVVAIESPPTPYESLPAGGTDWAVPPNPSGARGRRSKRKPKVKQPPPPRVAIKTEDVYALIETTLARTTANEASAPFGFDQALDTEPAGLDRFGAWETVTPPTAPSHSTGMRLRAAARWVGRLLRPKSGTDPEA